MWQAVFLLSAFHGVGLPLTDGLIITCEHVMEKTREPTNLDSDDKVCEECYQFTMKYKNVSKIFPVHKGCLEN